MNTTSSVSEILTNTNKKQLIPIGLNQLIPTGRYENDLLFVELSDLVNNQFRPWYCKMFYSLGREKVLNLASQARADGHNKQKLFSHLLKKNLPN